MPIITPFRFTQPNVNAPVTSQVVMPYNAGTVTLNVPFTVPMPNLNYVPTFSIGAGIALPAISISSKTVNGYVATFTALTAGTITANVIGL